MRKWPKRPRLPFLSDYLLSPSLNLWLHESSLQPTGGGRENPPWLPIVPAWCGSTAQTWVVLKPLPGTLLKDSGKGILPAGRNSGSPPGHSPERTNSLTKAELATAPAECPICQHQRLALGPQSFTITWGTSQLKDGSLVPLNHFHYGGSNSLFLLE